MKPGRPSGLKSKIFLDSGDPAETEAALDLLGFLDGQTSNPTLVARNPYARAKFERGEKFSSYEILDFYKQIITEISGLIPDGSVSIEVYADPATTAEAMLKQGSEMFSWIPNAHIKYPTTTVGLSAAEQSVKQQIRVNMTLCFSQEQAAAVYAATKGAAPGAVYVSPFVGRLDDIGQNGMDLVANTLKMYETGDGHVAVLAASVRTMEQFLESIRLGADIITAPFKLLEEWGKAGLPLPGDDFQYKANNLQPIPYQELDLNQPWQSFDIRHDLTDKGIDRFAADWKAILQ